MFGMSIDEQNRLICGLSEGTCLKKKTGELLTVRFKMHLEFYLGHFFRAF